jgi:16S rRNA (cytosine967-C5)-methyltransferase
MSPRVDPARAAAYDVLTAVREQDAYTNLLLPALLRSRGITGRDAAFTTALVAGTIRHQGSYDAILATLVRQPLERLQPGLLDALRLGTHQVLQMRVPAHAAVATTVDLVRAKLGRGPSGLANAVLRRVAQHDLDTWLGRVAPDQGADPVGHAAVTWSHPDWVVEELAAALQAEGAGEELEELLGADNLPPRVTLVARPGLCTLDELAGAEPTGRSPYAAVLLGGDPAELPAIAEGRAGVQDEGSQLVALALARAGLEGRDERWLDLCAGPGGKAALLAALAAGRGATLLAAERQPHRAALVRGAVRGPGLRGVVAADGTRPAWRPDTFDRVLVDAPCSGLGALRRRPEARWRRSRDDLADLVPLQSALLTSALDAVRPGGLVGYATCTPVLAETTEVVRRVLADRDDARLEDAAPLFDGVPDLRPERMPLPGTVQLWPHRQHTDAMFFALLRRADDR